MTGLEDYREHRKLNLHCYECGADLEEADFEWYDENPYCIECYDEIVLDEDLEQQVSGSYLEPDNICQTDNHGITSYAD